MGETAGAFGSPLSEEAPLWMITWDRIDLFLPELRQEVSRSKTPVARITYDTLPETSSPETSVPQTSFAEASNPATVPESTVSFLFLLPNCFPISPPLLILWFLLLHFFG